MQLPHVLDLHVAFHVGVHPLRDEYLPSSGGGTQPRRQVGHGADGAVVHPALETDGTDGGVTLRHGHTDTQVVASLSPALGEAGGRVAHGQAETHGAQRRVGDDHRIVEKYHHPVAGEALQRRLELQHQAPHGRMIFAQQAHDLLRLGGFGECGEAAQIDEHHGHFAPVADQRVFGATGKDSFGELRGKEALQPGKAL